MTAEQLTEAPRRRVKPVWIVVGLALVLLLAGVGVVVLQGYRQRQLVQLVEQHGGRIVWTPEEVAGLPTPVPFLQSPLLIGLQQTDGPGLRRFSRALRHVHDFGDLLDGLVFEECTIAGDDFATLPDLSQLTGIGFSDMNVDATTIGQLDRFPELQNLYLKVSTVDDEALSALPVLPRLANLSLAQTRVRGPGLAQLPQLPKLTALDLAGSSVTSEGVAVLAGCANLESLYLDNTQIDDEAVEYLLQLPALRELSASNTQLTEQGLGRLVEKFPDLEVWDD